VSRTVDDRSFPVDQVTLPHANRSGWSQMNGVVCSRSNGRRASRAVVSSASRRMTSTSLPSGQLAGCRLLT